METPPPAEIVRDSTTPAGRNVVQELELSHRVNASLEEQNRELLRRAQDADIANRQLSSKLDDFTIALRGMERSLGRMTTRLESHQQENRRLWAGYDYRGPPTSPAHLIPDMYPGSHVPNGPPGVPNVSHAYRHMMPLPAYKMNSRMTTSDREQLARVDGTPLRPFGQSISEPAPKPLDPSASAFTFSMPMHDPLPRAEGAITKCEHDGT